MRLAVTLESFLSGKHQGRRIGVYVCVLLVTARSRVPTRQLLELPGPYGRASWATSLED